MLRMVIIRGGSRRCLSSCATVPANTAQNSCKTLNIAGIPRVQLIEELQNAIPTIKPAVVNELFKQFYRKQIHSIADFDLLSTKRRDELSQYVHLGTSPILDRSISQDGTVKWLIGVGSQAYGEAMQSVETVFIPERSVEGTSRGTLCVSSQVGCSLACSFCRTGTQKPGKNLSATDIIGQFMAAKGDLATIAADGSSDSPVFMREITNVVFMGQGEPLYNFRNVSAAVRVMTDDLGPAIASRRVTISTSGVAPLMPRVGSDLKASLALSLHAPNDELRSRIMNINRTYSLSAVMDACKKYAVTKDGTPRRMMWEYTMLEGVNDHITHADQVIKLIRDNGLSVAVNLIPFNPWPGTDYRTSPDEIIMQFYQHLMKHGVLATVRWPRGRDILAACGQLRSESMMAG